MSDLSNVFWALVGWADSHQGFIEFCLLLVAILAAIFAWLQANAATRLLARKAPIVTLTRKPKLAGEGFTFTVTARNYALVGLTITEISTRDGAQVSQPWSFSKGPRVSVHRHIGGAPAEGQHCMVSFDIPIDREPARKIGIHYKWDDDPKKILRIYRHV